MAVDQEAIANDMTTQIALVNAAIAAAGVLNTASLSQLQPVVEVIENAVNVFNADAALIDADIDQNNFGGVDPTQPAQINIGLLLTQASDVSQLAVLLESENYLARASINIQQATG
jgi:hypothetical protein